MDYKKTDEDIGEITAVDDVTTDVRKERKVAEKEKISAGKGLGKTRLRSYRFSVRAARAHTYSFIRVSGFCMRKRTYGLFELRSESR